MIEIENKGQFNDHLKEDVATLHRIYEKWHFAYYAPKGMNNVLELLLDVKFEFNELIK